MGTKTITLAIYKMYKNSYKKYHLLIFILTIITYFAILISKVIIDDEKKTNILGGISLLSSFFLFTLQNMEFGFLNKNYKNLIYISANSRIAESVVIRSTIFSLATSTFGLVALCFIFELLSVNYIFLLVWSIYYIFTGIIFTVVLWNYFASKKEDNQQED